MYMLFFLQLLRHTRGKNGSGISATREYLRFSSVITTNNNIKYNNKYKIYNSLGASKIKRTL